MRGAHLWWEEAVAPGAHPVHDIGSKVEEPGLNFNLGWHRLRHSYKVFLELTRIDVTVERDLMRHADIHTTLQVYG